jgi:hypothetical protein
MSAPAEKSRPLPARTKAPVAASAATCRSAAASPARTSRPGALTGGLSIAMLGLIVPMVLPPGGRWPRVNRGAQPRKRLIAAAGEKALP